MDIKFTAPETVALGSIQRGYGILAVAAFLAVPKASVGNDGSVLGVGAKGAKHSKGFSVASAAA